MINNRSAHNFAYKPRFTNLIKEIDQRIVKSEDILGFGLGVAMFSSLLAPMASPEVLLPGLALNFAVTTILANRNYNKIKVILKSSMILLDYEDRQRLLPLIKVFEDCPVNDLADGFNPLKNLKRTWKSVFGGIIMNPLWIPIFYAMGMQINEEKNIIQLNQALIKLESENLNYQER